MTYIGGRTKTYEAQPRNMINICAKCRFDIVFISGSYSGHRQHTTYDIRYGQRQEYCIGAPR